MAQSGVKATGSVYGYERSNDKSLKVVESESVVVSKIFKLYSEHKSLGKVKVDPFVKTNFGKK